MEYFSELRDVVKKVQRGVEEVKELASRPPSEDDMDDHCLLLMLREKTKEMINIKSEACTLLTSLRQNGFIEKVAACEALYDKNLEALEKTESYLKQYGYTPKPVELDGSNTGQDTKQQQSDNHISDERTADTSGDTGNCEDDVPAGDLNTPVQFNRPMAPVLGTPKMADYGISAATMNMLSERKDPQNNSESKLQSNGWPANPELHKTSENRHNDYSCSYQLISEQQAADNRSPVPPVFCTPGAKQIRKTLHEQERANDDGVSVNITPEPPVLCAPGAKQIYGGCYQHDPPRTGVVSENITPEPPILMTPGLPPLTGRKERSADVKNDTPEPPFLCTPGVKQIQKVPGHNRLHQHSEESSWHFKDDNVDTPEPPVLTSDFGRLLNLGKYKDVGTGRSHSETENTLGSVDNAELRDREKMGDGSPDSNFLRGRPILLQCDTPEAPELTFSYKDLLSSRTNITSAAQDPRPVSPKRSQVMTSFSPTAPQQQPVRREPAPTVPILSNYALNTPPAPELTGKYGFIEAVSNTQTSHASTSDSIGNKENLLPAHTKAVVKQQDLPFVYIPRISDEEYQEQPSYLRKMLPQEKINQLIMQLNQVLADRLQAGEEAIVSQDDLQNSFDAVQIQSVFLCLSSLKRLSRKYKTDGTSCYELC